MTRENWRKSVPLFRMWVPLTWERCEEKHDVVEDDGVVEQQEDGDLFSFQQWKWLTQYSLHSYLSFLVNMIVSSQYEVHLKQSFLKRVFCSNSKSPHGWVFMLVFTSGTFSARRMSLGVLIWVNAITYSHPALRNCSYIRQRFYVWDQKLMYEKRTNEFWMYFYAVEICSLP